MSFNIGLSGLYAAQKDLAVTGNNIANSATTGFKESRAEFADIYSHFRGCIQKATGAGVRLANVSQQFHQGDLKDTQNSLDLAISGEGFFTLDNNGSKVYSRDGAFSVDRDGYIVNNSGLRLQVYERANNSDGYAYDAAGNLEKVTPDMNTSEANPFFTRTLTDLQLDFGGQPASASTSVAIDMNLVSDAQQILDPSGTAVPFDVNDPDTYHYSTSVTLYDSLGTPRNVGMYYQKTANPLQWDVYFHMEGAATGVAPIGPQPLEFDSNGNLVLPTPTSTPPRTLLPVTFNMANYAPDNGATIGPLDGAGTATNTVAFDFTDLTQVGTRYAVNDLTQDGYTGGNLVGFSVDDRGVVFARYSNDKTKALGQVALASFKNPQGLQQLGNNVWAQNHLSGDAVYDAPGHSRLGSIQSCALESSNVDLATELVDLITAQRNYQANAKTISTSDEMTQTILNLR